MFAAVVAVVAERRAAVGLVEQADHRVVSYLVGAGVAAVPSEVAAGIEYRLARAVGEPLHYQRPMIG